MNWKKITQIVTFAVIPAFIVGILVYDAIAIVKSGGSEASISSLIISMSYKMPMIPFVIGSFLGFFSGHLFWRMKSNKDTILIDKRN